MWVFTNIFFLIFGGLFGLDFLATADHVEGSKIIGGRDTNITEVPWQLLHFVNGTQFAGGVIIGPREVLTAGHCFSMGGGTSSFHQYRAGSDQLSSGGKNHTVEYFVIHPGFDMTEQGIFHDIAFARVKEPFEFSETVQPIKLAKKEPKGGEEALLSGFGIWKIELNDTTNITVELPSVLQSVILPIVDRETCKEWYSDFVYDVMDDQICAGLLEGGVSACNGDSGGPMVINNELVGITSWGLCASPHHPSVYTSVPYYLDWIEEQLNSSK